jgi:hypothetical protein
MTAGPAGNELLAQAIDYKGKILYTISIKKK